MDKINKPMLKELFGSLPLTAEMYWYLRRQAGPVGGLNLSELQSWIPAWQTAAANSSFIKKKGKRILLFATLGYWIQHSSLLGLCLAAFGHEIKLAYLPYANWQKRAGHFNLRMQNVYIRSVLAAAEPLIQVLPWYDGITNHNLLPEELQEAVAKISRFDVMYSNQTESVDISAPLYQLRLERNSHAAGKALQTLQSERPELLIVPNGSILEFGAVYQAARSLDIPVITYEFGEQRDRIWTALNEEVMHQNTNKLWSVYKDVPLSETEWKRIRELFASRQKASLWENFSRQWQDIPGRGGESVRRSLNLDHRPIVLLPSNVIGDSLTLDRQIFSMNMTDWLVQTVTYFKHKTEVQLVIRIHPGERYIKGPSVAEVIQQAVPNLPDHIQLIPHDAPVNTYDLIQIADLGLVYTTTVGLEMAMSGVPVIAAGDTHYRERGFTLEPTSWQTYFDLLEQFAQEPDLYQLSRQQTEQAWNYAYRFFFEYPMPFPWHVLYMPKDAETWPLQEVLSEKGQQLFADTFHHLSGGMRHWEAALPQKVNRI